MPSYTLRYVLDLCKILTIIWIYIFIEIMEDYERCLIKTLHYLSKFYKS